MKKEYKNPMLELVHLDTGDILFVSNELPDEESPF